MKQNITEEERSNQTYLEHPEDTKGILEVNNLSAWYGKTLAIKNISMNIRAKTITAIIGPSGCGKSTFIRCLNRMHEVAHGGRAEGCIMLDGRDIYARDADPVVIRRVSVWFFRNRLLSR